MKIQAEHYQAIQSAFHNRLSDVKTLQAALQAGGKTRARFLWESFWLIQVEGSTCQFTKKLYDYLNDANIEAALSKIARGYGL